MAALERVPGKVVAVHVSYRSRAAERGSMPAWPSYFFKPSSSLAESGDPVARPPGCELLAFEGEVALVIGRRARHVRPADGWDHVDKITAANDFGVYDLRYADRGSNVRSKGIDGFTPVGPRLIDARGAELTKLRLRTWVNGELAQDSWPAQDMLFGFGDIVADLSRLLTLEPGDVILTGTPTGSTVVQPGDVVEVEVSAGDQSSGRLRSPIVEADYRLDPPGAMPRADDAERAAAYGAARGAAYGTAHQPARTAPSRDQAAELLAGLRTVSTATLAALLRKRGLNGLALDGLRSTKPGARLAGFARTVRYLPLREDLSARYGGGMNAQRRAVEAIRPGEVLVIEARGEPNAGTIGDILALRAQVRGAAGVVTDGAIRDSAVLAGLDIPVYHAAVHPAVLGRRHVPWETDVAVACAGATIQPGDIVVGDADGVLVLPPALAAEVLAEAREQERQEEFIATRVAAGESIDGLFPLTQARRPDYEAWLAQQLSPDGAGRPDVTVPAGLPAKLDHFIGGVPAASAGGATFEVADPVSNQPYAAVAAGGPADVDQAVTAASQAFTAGPWPGLPAQGPQAAAARLAFRVRTAADLGRAEAFYAALGSRTARLPAGVTPGVGEAVRAEDPLGFTVEFFFAADHPPRLQQRYDLRRGAEPARLDHFNIVVPDVRAAYEYYASLGFGLSETIEDGGTLYAAWMFRKQTVHDVAFTGGDGPRLHHLGFFAHESHQVLRICDILGALHEEFLIERGPGRHGVSNAFYVYLRDPDGHRVEIYTSDYYTGDPDHPVLRWSVRDPRRRDFWGHAVIPSWYTEASTVLDLDGRPRPLVPEQQPAELKAAEVGADGFTRPRP